MNFQGVWAYLDKGRISEDHVNGGCCAEDMQSMFCASDMAPSKDDKLHERVETYLLIGTGLHKDDSIVIGHLVSRKIFAHMEYGRSHEGLAYDDWSASYMDFCHLIPDENRYWAIGRDYWKYRYIYN
ncbi:hypothetical protein M440DRAFT_23557 [Trichoderma longibrachiatum ATCC 18648]|uniref:Uncharacterized protein n=1 Tax=Trichoderma longibrachiatum ATCC 18648 TaxID=983965 RepID=A0A2T4BP38_TRILO|nr:hypothetical protein M440DRAFT_23557 [Trichoderma longibrachiatum ATCC 18648]